MTAILPTDAQINAFLNKPQTGEAVVMVNLLKFKDKASYEPDRPEAKEGLTGAEAYLRYGAGVTEVLGRIGAKPLYSGPVASFMIGAGDWDMVAMVRYPDRKTFIEMGARDDYQAIHYHREAGLSHQDLIETLPLMIGD